MDDRTQADERGELDRARATIARQAEELERLRRQLGEERLAERLREALALATATGTIASPVTHSRLLEMIVETAAHIISARAGSISLVDERAGELVFEVSIGPQAQEIKKIRLPLGQGIAGLVAVCGQPIAVSDAPGDPRFASDVAASTGYVPTSLLCVPLYHEDRVIGVLELLDKEGDRSFSPADMEALGLFANLAAVAVEQSRVLRNLASLFWEAVDSLGEERVPRWQGLEQRAEDLVGLEEDPTYRQALELAGLVHEIAHQGEDEREAYRVILKDRAGYLRSRSQPSSGAGTH